MVSLSWVPSKVQGALSAAYKFEFDSASLCNSKAHEDCHTDT